MLLQKLKEQQQQQSGAEGSRPRPTTMVRAEEWFAGGRRVNFDPNHKKIMPEATSNTIRVFERVADANASSVNDDDGNDNDTDDDRLWLTMLPSFPGSYGLAKLEPLFATTTTASAIQSDATATTTRTAKYPAGSLPSSPLATSLPPPPPRLYVDYVGQGNSEKPADYAYRTGERADLVQALWAARGVARTAVVACGHSSLVVLELLRRQQERDERRRRQGHGHDKAAAAATTTTTTATTARIEHVLILNGCLYADGYTRRQQRYRHPAPLPFALPVIHHGQQQHRHNNNRRRRWSASLAQRSNLVLDWWLRPYCSSQNVGPGLMRGVHRQHRTKGTTTRGNRRHHDHHHYFYYHHEQPRRQERLEELRETEKVIRLHDGTATFLTAAAAFVEEHLQEADRWDLSTIYLQYARPAGINVDIVGSTDDPFVSQVALVQERLGSQYHPDVRTCIIPGGHLLTSAQAPLVVERILAMVERAQPPAPARNESSLQSSENGTDSVVVLEPPRQRTTSREPCHVVPAVA